MDAELEFDNEAPLVEAALADLTEMQRQFAIFTFRGCSPQDAARRAGYTGDNIDSQASRLLRHPKILRALEALALSPDTRAPENPTQALKQGLWAIVRSAHPRDRISATALLHRIHESEQAKERTGESFLARYVQRPGGREELSREILRMTLDSYRSDLAKGIFPYPDEANREDLREIARLAAAIAELPSQPSSEAPEPSRAISPTPSWLPPRL